MITLNNPQNLDIYSTFIDDFGEIIKFKYEGNSITISGVNGSWPNSQFVDIKSVPFATNTELRDLIIVINEEICESLDLSQNERYAMISHEIGHIIDPTPRNNNHLLREINADSFAVELGLSHHLISGLQKLIYSGKYDTEIDMIKVRINKINENP